MALETAESPPTLVTVTLPLIAPGGTVASICVPVGFAEKSAGTAPTLTLETSPSPEPLIVKEWPICAGLPPIESILGAILRAVGLLADPPSSSP